MVLFSSEYMQRSRWFKITLSSTTRQFIVFVNIIRRFLIYFKFVAPRKWGTESNGISKIGAPKPHIITLSILQHCTIVQQGDQEELKKVLLYCCGYMAVFELTHMAKFPLDLDILIFGIPNFSRLNFVYHIQGNVCWFTIII